MTDETQIPDIPAVAERVKTVKVTKSRKSTTKRKTAEEKRLPGWLQQQRKQRLQKSAP